MLGVKTIPYLLVGCLVLCAATGITSYKKGNASGKAEVQAQWDAYRLEQQAAIQQAQADALEQSHQASTQYQEKKTHEEIKTRVVRQVVTRTVTGQCFNPDSLRIVNEAISGAVQPAASAGRPEATVSFPSLDSGWGIPHGGAVDRRYRSGVQGLSGETSGLGTGLA